MRALVLDGSPHVSNSFPEPSRAEGEALVAVRVAGICDTDLQLAQGYMGFKGVPGHEFVGQVLEATTPSWVGRRVVADINAGCGTCEDCLVGAGHHCATRTVLGILGRNGAFAERLVIPERCLVAVPDNVSDDRAVFAEPIAAALHVKKQLGRTSEPVAVLGDGKLGLLIALCLSREGYTVNLIGHHREKLAIAAASSIATYLEEEASPLLGGMATVVEATGSAAGLALALRLCRPKGTIVLKTTVKTPLPVDLSLAVINELQIVGSRCGDLAEAMAALQQGRIEPTPLIAARYNLANAEAAFERAGTRGVLKVLVDVQSSAQIQSHDLLLTR